MPIITSPDNIQLKQAVSLKQKKFRDQKQLFLIEGIRLIETASSAAEIKECFYTAEALTNERCAVLINTLQDKGCRMYEVSNKLFAKLADTDSPQGIIAVVDKKHFSLADFPKNDHPPVYVVLDQLQDPGNVGTIIRTAEASGVDGIIAMRGTVDIYSPKVIRATMGAVFFIPIVDKVTPVELHNFITENNINVFATVLSSTSTPCFAVNYKQPSAVILGNEGKGIAAEMQELADTCIYIPMYGKSESLNASSAAAMVMYEIMRQRHFN